MKDQPRPSKSTLHTFITIFSISFPFFVDDDYDESMKCRERRRWQQKSPPRPACHPSRTDLYSWTREWDSKATNYTEIEASRLIWNNNFCHFHAAQLVECAFSQSSKRPALCLSVSSVLGLWMRPMPMMIRRQRREDGRGKLQNWKVPLKCKPDGCIIFCQLNERICGGQKKCLRTTCQARQTEMRAERKGLFGWRFRWRDLHWNHWNAAHKRSKEWWTMNLLRAPHMCTSQLMKKINDDDEGRKEGSESRLDMMSNEKEQKSFGISSFNTERFLETR